jgi:hypothetical protein
MEVVRLSIIGNYCVHCNTKIEESIACKECGWIDPMTRSTPKAESDE